MLHGEPQPCQVQLPQQGEKVTLLGIAQDRGEVGQFLFRDPPQQVQIQVLLVLKVLVEAALGDASRGYDAVDAGLLKGVGSKLCDGGPADQGALCFAQVEECVFWHDLSSSE